MIYGRGGKFVVGEWFQGTVSDPCSKDSVALATNAQIIAIAVMRSGAPPRNPA